MAATGGIYAQTDDREVPDTFPVALDYPSEHSMVLLASMCNRTPTRIVIRGREDTIEFYGVVAGDRPSETEKHILVRPEREFAEKFKAKYGQEEARLENRPRPNQMENWLECIRSRRKPNGDVETAYRVMAAICLAVAGIRQSLQARRNPDPASRPTVADTP